MALPHSQAISQEQYHRLREHASQQPDFVFLGSPGDGQGRGYAAGFSSNAVDYLQVPQTPGAGIGVKALAADMERRCAPYKNHLHAGQPPNIAMVGGWIGAISYEFGYGREPRLAPLAQNNEFPALFAGLYLWMASELRGAGTYYLWVHPQLPESQQEMLCQWLETPADAVQSNWRFTERFSACQSPDSFRASIEEIKQYIRSGDCYQANLSQMFKGRYQGNPWQGFKALSEANPTPYAAYLKHGGDAVLSISPERFLSIENRIIHTSPIKGTRPRGTTPAHDQALADELLSSEKDRAENLMIVDLLRNDLGLHAVTGSVTVDKLFALESFRNVHHLVSHIRATLHKDISPLQAMFEAFPGGSITGAPKIRAMEIIAELEPHHRGPYCGSVFYYGLDGRLDSNIAIRTLLCNSDGTIRCWGGGGIVSDSDPEAEYQETLAKVGPLMRFLEELVIG